MRDKYNQRVTVRISDAMLNELNEFTASYNTSKNSIIRQAISNWFNNTQPVPAITIKQPEKKPVKKNDAPFSDSIYNW